MGRLKLTTDAKKTKYVPHALQHVRGGLIASFMALFIFGYGDHAYAQTNAQSQSTPENKIDFGAGGVSDSSFKFGEYNGLQNSGPFGIGNFDVNGGAKFDSRNSTRWHFEGRNLGLETRSLYGDFGKQGRIRFFAGYSELLANRSDTYQTPYLGIHTGNFTLPSTWLFPSVAQRGATTQNFRVFDVTAGSGSYYNGSGVLTAPTAAQLSANATVRAADVPAFQPVYLSTKRTDVVGGVNYNPSSNVDIPLSYMYEHKDGLKALGAVSSQVQENSVTLPIPIDFDTNQANAGVGFRFKQTYVAFGYYGSFFKDNVSSVTWQDVADPTKTATMATAPSNQFNQFTFLGAEKFKHNMKLVVAGSYGRNTQNDAFLGPSTANNGQLAFGLPANSLNGLVVSSMANAKFTAKPTKKLNLVAAYKFFNRDNQTPIHTYYFQDANESKSGTSNFAGLYGNPAGLGSNTNIYQNRAYSQMTNQADGEAEIVLPHKQWVTASYQWLKADRSCAGAWIDCSDAATTNEHTAGAAWRTTSAGRFTGRLDYAASWRRGNYNENAFLALVPMANQIPTGGATVSAFAFMQQTGETGFGPIAGFPTTPLTGNAAIFTPNNNIVPQALYASRNNINELPGMRRYMVADRNGQRVQTDLDWQTTERLSLHGNGQYHLDDYFHSVYGLRKDSFWEASMDATYAVSDDLVMNVFYTYDNHRYFSRGDAYGTNSNAASVGQAADTAVSGGCYSTVLSKNLSAKIDPCLNWQKNDRDKNDTAGFSIDKKKLLSKKLEFGTQVLYTRARTDTAVGGGSYVNNPLALAAPAPPLPSSTAAVYFIPAQNYPVVRDDEVTVWPTAQYEIEKRFTLRAFYLFQKFMSSDWAYQGMQYGTGTNYLPTVERAPNYAISAGGMSLDVVF
jgi:MtrB/PioB family decaheme-associated outer membrane protein